MCGGAPSTPTPPPPPAAPPRQPRLADEGVRKAREDAKKRNRMAGARSQTLLTGPQGLTTTANTQKKTLLGA